MLIVIGSDGSTLGSQVSKRFGRASYYITYDIESGLFDVVENNNQLAELKEPTVKRSVGHKTRETRRQLNNHKLA